jgi:hypothetical protein
MAQRIKGQDVDLQIIQAGRVLTTLFNIKSFDFSYEFEVKKEGYLGQKTDKRDTVFNGISGKLEIHPENQSILIFMEAVRAKAENRTPGVQFNIRATLNFPGGDRPRIIIPEVEWGAMPFSFGGRTEYGMVSVPYEASSANVLTV